VLFGSVSDQDVSEPWWRGYRVIAGPDGRVAGNQAPRAPLARPRGRTPTPKEVDAMPEPIHSDNRAQPVALVVQLHAETVSRVDVTAVSRDNSNDRLVSVAIGDDHSGVRLLGQLRDLHRLVIEADQQLTRLTNVGGDR
jgi:hypothetical protein